MSSTVLLLPRTLHGSVFCVFDIVLIDWLSNVQGQRCCSYLEYLMAEYYEMAERLAERLRDSSAYQVSQDTLIHENEALSQQLMKVQRQMMMIERVFERYNSAAGDQEGDIFIDADRVAVDATFPLLPPIAGDIRFGVSRHKGIGDQAQALDTTPTLLPAIVPHGSHEGVHTPSPRARTADSSVKERRPMQSPTTHD